MTCLSRCKILKKNLLYTNLPYISLVEKHLTLRKRPPWAGVPRSTQPGQSPSAPFSQPERGCRRWRPGTDPAGHPPRGTAKQSSIFKKNIFPEIMQENKHCVSGFLKFPDLTNPWYRCTTHSSLAGEADEAGPPRAKKHNQKSIFYGFWAATEYKIIPQRKSASVR